MSSSWLTQDARFKKTWHPLPLLPSLALSFSPASSWTSPLSVRTSCFVKLWFYIPLALKKTDVCSTVARAFPPFPLLSSSFRKYFSIFVKCMIVEYFDDFFLFFFLNCFIIILRIENLFNSYSIEITIGNNYSKNRNNFYKMS